MIDAPVPTPAEGTLLVRVGACGVCGSDLHIVDWELGAERMVARLPVILGHEPAGEVVEVGARVTNFKVGDRVALDPFGHCGRCGPCRAGRFHLCAAPTTLSGAFAEYTIAPVGNAHLVPSAMSVEQAALLEPFGTGLHAVEQSCLKAGDSAVVEGPGPIGLSIALAARALGVTSIVMTGLAVDADRLALARTMGFKTVCAGDRDWIEQARALLPADGADVVFDAAGAIDSPRELLRRGGELIEVGWPARDLKSAELRSLVFSRRHDHQLAHPHSGNLAPRNRDGLKRRGGLTSDGHTSLFYLARPRSLRPSARAPRSKGADNSERLAIS